MDRDIEEGDSVLVVFEDETTTLSVIAVVGRIDAPHRDKKETFFISIAGEEFFLDSLEDKGYHVSVHQKRKATLPTEDGIYFPFPEFRANTRVLKLDNGIWCEANGYALDKAGLNWISNCNRDGNLTKFVPAEEVSQRIFEYVFNRGYVTEETIRHIARELGYKPFKGE